LLATLKQFIASGKKSKKILKQLILEPKKTMQICAYCLHRYSAPFSGWSTVHYKQNKTQVLQTYEKKRYTYTRFCKLEWLSVNDYNIMMQHRRPFKRMEENNYGLPNQASKISYNNYFPIVTIGTLSFFSSFHFFSFVRCAMTGHSHAKFFVDGRFCATAQENNRQFQFFLRVWAPKLMKNCHN
jgi:hypothetical protein